jgi:hypothetical protein
MPSNFLDVDPRELRLPSSRFMGADPRRLLAMIHPVRQEMLQLLERLSVLAPEVRFGQLVANLTLLAEGPWDEALWDVEDERLLEAMRQHVADLQARGERVA